MLRIPQETPAEQARRAAPKAGEPFNPARKVCGFWATDAVDRQRDLSDGAKLVYHRLTRFATDQRATCFASTEWLAKALGKSPRETDRDLQQLVNYGLIRRYRHGRNPRSLEFLWHTMFDSNAPSVADQSESPNAPSVADQTKGLISHPALSNPPSGALHCRW